MDEFGGTKTNDVRRDDPTPVGEQWHQFTELVPRARRLVQQDERVPRTQLHVVE
ncbi:hypothetical protein [Rhizomonospora bruguierae]|uniref:hypothetical protein n=1 Tax=Rhizomonospora bruguierae TaxID=1581705 RepID=UPI001BCAD184|nr:hypothetical protein [Micromonospora sp. NBRC 107566]